MFKNYIKTGLRNLLRNKIHASINIFGLSVGIACCLLISLYVFDELSYDRFFKDHSQIYRVSLERIYPDHTRDFASSSVMLAPTLLESYPDVEKATRMHRLFFAPEVAVTIDDVTFQESQFRFADSLFFDVLSFKFIEGNPTTALDAPDKVVLTRQSAEKYFGTIDVVGNSLETAVGELQISAVIENLPSNSHMHFDLMGSIRAIGYLDNAIQQANWTSPWLYTYVKLLPGTDPQIFEEKIKDVVKNYGAASIQNEVGLNIDDYIDSGHEYNYFLQPITSIHLHSNLDVELEANSNITYVYILIVIVAFLLLISCINFINLSTARSGERAREVGIRKVMGSTKSRLIRQFLAEAILISLISLVISLIITWIALPYFNKVVEKNLVMEILLNPIMGVTLFVFAIGIGVIAGFYPSLVISSIEAAVVLKGDYQSGKSGTWLRNSLVVFQFFISIVLISGVLMVGNQLDYIRNKNLGFEKENILVIKQIQNLGLSYQSFRDEVTQLPGVMDAGGTFIMPGGFFGSNLYTPDDPELPVLRANVVAVDDHYIKTMKIEVLEGREFGVEFNDSLNVLINEAAVKVLGWDDPIGRTITPVTRGDSPSPELRIIGVLKDFNFESLHKKVFPMVISNGNSGFVPGVLAIKLKPGDPEMAIDAINAKWNEVSESQEMLYSFFDSDLDLLYKAEQTSKKIFDAFTTVAIIMACVGLFGLTSYMAQQRTKEIGIRKVMGASVPQIVILLSRELTKLIAISLLIAIPIAYYLIKWWLKDFEYRVIIGPEVFTIAGFVTFLLAWFTISYQSIKSALMNPIKSIRSE